MSSYQELLKQRESLDQKIKEAAEKEKAEGVAKVKAIMEQYCLVPSDIFSKKVGGPRQGVKVAPKYKNPLTGETWTGRGKAPKWIDVNNRNKFSI